MVGLNEVPGFRFQLAAILSEKSGIGNESGMGGLGTRDSVFEGEVE
jgi:hypothetical protein